MLLLLLVLAPIWAGFHTPSGNIVCNASRRHIDCVVFSETRGGQATWSMDVTGPARRHIVFANIGTEVPELAYGLTFRFSGFTCASRRAGLTCRNRSRHGFFLSRARQRIF